MQTNSFIKNIWDRFATLADPTYSISVDVVRRSRVTIFLTMVLMTSVIMWAYAFVADTYIDSPTMSYAGYIYAALHLSSLLILRLTGSTKAASWTVLVPGYAFQLHFAALSGGFFAPTIIWVAILPVIAGMITNIAYSLFWTAISAVSVIGFSIAQGHGLFPASALRPDGLWIVQLLVAMGLLVLVGAFTVFMLMIMDGSTEAQRQRALEKASLLQTMSHDLLTPLTVALVLAKPASSGELNLDSAKSGLLNSNLQRINRTIQAVRFVESLESGKQNLELQTLDLHECVDGAISLMEPVIKRKHIKVLTKNRPKGQILGHKDMIENQIIANILSNAIKFSHDGGAISISYHDYDESIELHIQDEGNGVPASILPLLFDPLAATSKVGTAGEKGTGFGLPIVKKFISILGGTIVVQSPAFPDAATNRGTRVCLAFRRGGDQLAQSVFS
jgi:signal transduction histidine kinase